MTTYGVTPEGFVRKPLEQILADINARQKATISEDFDNSTESVDGQCNGIVAREISMAWEALEDCYDAFDRDKAEDATLVNLAKLTGTEKRDATYSVVTMQVNLDTGTELEAGVHFVALETDPDVRFTPEENYTATADGTVSLVFRAENKGPVVAPSGELTVIATPVTGWNSATNGSAATPGIPVDSNETLRERSEAQITTAGSTTLLSLAADVAEVSGVISVLAFENTSSVIDPEGIPPNSFEIVVWDGETPAADDNEIAETIWDNRSGGMQPFGSESGTFEDANGTGQTVHFSRFTVQSVWLEFDLAVDEDFVAADFQTALETAANEFHTGGKSVLTARLVAMALEQDHVDDVVAVRLGFATNPAGTANLEIGSREIARFSSARIDVTEV